MAVVFAGWADERAIETPMDALDFFADQRTQVTSETSLQTSLLVVVKSYEQKQYHVCDY